MTPEQTERETETCEAVLAEKPGWRGAIRDAYVVGWLARAELDRGNMPSLFRVPQDKGGLDAIIGKWPGDETDEEIEEALREMKGSPVMEGLPIIETTGREGES